MLNAKAAIAPAVVFPMPGSFERSSGSSGSLPRYSVMMTSLNFLSASALRLYLNPCHTCKISLIEARESAEKLSEVIMTEYRGKLPEDPELLSKLPGIGKTTAGAIAAFAFNMPVLFVETNIRRVFLYHFFQGKEKVQDDEIFAVLKLAMDGQNPREWYYALMDYGAWLGTFPGNPNRKSAHYAKQSPFHGSNREVRGKILTLLLVKRSLTRSGIAKHLSQQQERVRAILTHLEQEGFVVKEKDTFSLA